jgi:hypothetical protein
MPQKLYKNKDFFDQQFDTMKQSRVDDSEDAVRELATQSKHPLPYRYRNEDGD